MFFLHSKSFTGSIRRPVDPDPDSFELFLDLNDTQPALLRKLPTAPTAKEKSLDICVYFIFTLG